MFGEAKRAELEAIYHRRIERFGAEWAYYRYSGLLLES